MIKTEKIAIGIVNKGIKVGAIEKNLYPEYVYSYQIVIELLISCSTLLVMSIFFSKIPETIMFILFSFALRFKSGGYHAKTFSGCLSLSVLSYLLFCLIVYPIIFNIQVYYTYISFVLISIMIFFIAPVEHPHSPMSRKKINHYKHHTRFVLVVETIILFALFMITRRSAFILFAIFSHISVLLSLIVQKIINIKTSS